MAIDTSPASCAGHQPSGRRSFRKQRTVNPLTGPARYNFPYSSSRPALRAASGRPPARQRHDAHRSTDSPSAPAGPPHSRCAIGVASKIIDLGRSRFAMTVPVAAVRWSGHSPCAGQVSAEGRSRCSLIGSWPSRAQQGFSGPRSRSRGPTTGWSSTWSQPGYRSPTCSRPPGPTNSRCPAVHPRHGCRRTGPLRPARPRAGRRLLDLGPDDSLWAREGHDPVSEHLLLPSALT